MSFLVFGRFVLSRPHTYREKVEVSYFLLQDAVNQKVGLTMEGNTEWIRWTHPRKNKDTEILFTLSDNPLTNVAEVLFSQEGEKVYFNNERMDEGECMNARMLRIKTFCTSVLSHAAVLMIDLKLNLDFHHNQEDGKHKISVDKLDEILLRHLQDNRWNEELWLSITKG